MLYQRRNKKKEALGGIGEWYVVMKTAWLKTYSDGMMEGCKNIFFLQAENEIIENSDEIGDVFEDLVR